MPYPAVTPVDLYDVSTSRKHELGTEMQFKDAAGEISIARYVQNISGATQAAGQVVAYQGKNGQIGGAAATNTPPDLIAGGLACSMASDSTAAFGWVIFKGKQTNASASAATASSSGDRALAWVAADLAVAAATYASTTAGYAQVSVCALLKANAALATGGVNTVYWTWK